MSKIHFSIEQQEELKNNPYVKSVTSKAITYTEEFKELFYKEYQEGRAPTEIMRGMGFDTKVIGRGRIRSIAERMRKYAQRDDGFVDQRQYASGQSQTKDLTIEEQLERANHKIALLKQENEFLKKLEQIERNVQRNIQRQSKNSN